LQPVLYNMPADGSLTWFRSKSILSKVAKMRILAWLPLSMRILVTSHLPM
jgi:hypothetical protein